MKARHVLIIWSLAMAACLVIERAAAEPSVLLHHATTQLIPPDIHVEGLQPDPLAIVRVDIYRRNGTRESLILPGSWAEKISPEKD